MGWPVGDVGHDVGCIDGSREGWDDGCPEGHRVGFLVLGEKVGDAPILFSGTRAISNEDTKHTFILMTFSGKSYR